MSNIVMKGAIFSERKTKKIPQEIGDIIAEAKRVEDLICDVCTKLDDPEFDLKQLQASLVGIRSALDGEPFALEC